MFVHEPVVPMPMNMSMDMLCAMCEVAMCAETELIFACPRRAPRVQ
jgi:hypothetical protein